MKAYLAYQDSRYDWTGDIPEHWKMVQLKFAAPRKTDQTSDVKELGLQIALENIESGTGKLLNNGSFEGVGNVFRQGDVLFNKLRPYLNKVVIAPDAGVAVGELLVLRPANNFDSRYLFYRLVESQFISIVDGSTYGAKMPRANWDFIGNLKVPCPPLPEQKTIANFLDRKTAQIDDLIAKKQRQIDLLHEQRTALINQAVTGKLDLTGFWKPVRSGRPMKDSDVEWLGEIPSHWEVVKLKYIGKAFIGLTYNPENVTDEENGTLVFRASNVKDGKIVFDDNVYVKMEIPERLITKVGDILICVRSGSRDLIGKNALIDEKSAGYAFGAFMTVFRSDINYFLSYVFSSQLFKVQSGIFNTSTVNQLTQGSLYSFQVAIPPIDEQEEIIQFLNNELAQIDETINRVVTQIELLQEYRTALISAAVTGKIDVREG